jgi:hypothetical protein
MRAGLGNPTSRSWQQPKRPAHVPVNLADYGFNVTIGIAAKSKDDECIVTVSDRRTSFDDLVPSIDSGVNKNWFIGKNWGALCAANDTCFVLPIISRANNLLSERGGTESIGDVKLAVCDAFADVRRDYVTRQYLFNFGIKSIDQFRKEGPSTLGRKLFWSLARKIENESLEQTTLLIYGYGPDFTPHLFEVKNPGYAYLLDHFQYFAIGSGATIAMASLNLKPVSHLNAAQLIYRVLEAKFAAEASSAVGKSTLVLISNRGKPTTFLSFGIIERIRKLWENSRFTPPPNEINELIVETPPIPLKP